MTEISRDTVSNIKNRMWDKQKHPISFTLRWISVILMAYGAWHYTAGGVLFIVIGAILGVINPFLAPAPRNNSSFIARVTEGEKRFMATASFLAQSVYIAVVGGLYLWLCYALMQHNVLLSSVLLAANLLVKGLAYFVALRLTGDIKIAAEHAPQHKKQSARKSAPAAPKTAPNGKRAKIDRSRIKQARKQKRSH